jgi:hypothetical protein
VRFFFLCVSVRVYARLCVSSVNIHVCVFVCVCVSMCRFFVCVLYFVYSCVSAHLCMRYLCVFMYVSLCVFMSFGVHMCVRMCVCFQMWLVVHVYECL